MSKVTWPTRISHVASILKDEKPWLKHARLDHVSKKKKKGKRNSYDGQHKDKGAADGDRTSIARPWVVVHRM